MPNPVKPFVIESNASKFATGAVLQQQDDNRDWHPCRYISHSFNATQQNYKIYDRELLGIIWALETWRHYLQGSSHPTTILSNHKNLTYFRSAQKLNRRQARWSLFLSQFKLKLVHVPGSLGRDTGDPRVFFCQPIPAPTNTVPIRVGVWLPPWVLRVPHDVRGWQEPPCPPTAPACKKSRNCGLLLVQELRMGFLAPSSLTPTNHPMSSCS